jgi:protein TonB
MLANRKYFFISVLMHLLFVFIVSQQMITHTAGLETPNIIQAFIFETPLVKKTTPPSAKPVPTPLPKKISEHGILKTLKKITPIKKEEKIAPEASTAPNNTQQGEKTSRLIALLHDAIQKKQTYPDSAYAMGRQGKVRVSFILLTDGQITNLHIVASSGTESLDRAAVSAVKDAAPFQDVVKWIAKSQEYEIDIAFLLT